MAGSTNDALLASLAGDFLSSGNGGTLNNNSNSSGKGFWDIFSNSGSSGGGFDTMGLIQTGLNIFGNIAAADREDDIRQLQFDQRQQLQTQAEEATMAQLMAQLGLKAQLAEVEAKIKQRQLIQNAFNKLIEETSKGGDKTSSALTNLAVLGQRALGK